MSRCPYRTDSLSVSDEVLVISCYTLLIAHTLCGVLGTSRTASCHNLMGYVNSKWSSSLELLPPLGVVGVVPPVCEPLPLFLSLDGVLPLFLLLSLLARSMRLMVVSRLAEESSPVALARSFKPAMFLAMLKSSFVGAPSLTFKPMEKMARSGNLTFLPKRRSSLVQTTASVKMPLMAPLENGVLWLDMCSASSSRPMVSSATTRGYQLPYAGLSLLLF